MSGLAFQGFEWEPTCNQVPAFVSHLVALTVRSNAHGYESIQHPFERSGRDVVERIDDLALGENVRGAVAGDGVVPLSALVQFVQAVEVRPKQ